MEVKRVVEALLFGSSRPVTVEELQEAFAEGEVPDKSEILAAIDELATFYQETALELKLLASGYRFQVKPDYGQWVKAMLKAKAPSPKFSRALLETLAIIAYRQPVSRLDIEDIRCKEVSSHTMNTLLNRGWIKVIGKDETKGGTRLYGTTKEFLDYFNLSSLNELPTLSVLDSFDYDDM